MYFMYWLLGLTNMWVGYILLTHKGYPRKKEGVALIIAGALLVGAGCIVLTGGGQ